jgi:rubrerythrin
MRWTKPLLALACITTLTTSIAACSTPTSPPPSAPTVDGSTRTNALAAMHGEALAHAKYQAYAAQAQQAGHQQAAQAFTSAADAELSDHFTGEANLISLVSNNAAANLQDAIAGESYEVNTMYPEFARQAATAGDQAAANLFTEIAQDEAGHMKAFQTALGAINNPGSGLGIPSVSSNAALPISPGPAQSSGPTLTNLRTAMQGEAYAYAKYTLYAQQARRSGNPALAELFTKTAQMELGEHFAEEATLAGLVGDTAANLNDAIAGEKHEATTMYPDYARQANKVGDQQAAQLFTEIANDEKAHQQAFEAALQILPR